MIDTVLSTLDTTALWGVGLCLIGMCACLLLGCVLAWTLTRD